MFIYFLFQTMMCAYSHLWTLSYSIGLVIICCYRLMNQCTIRSSVGIDFFCRQEDLLCTYVVELGSLCYSRWLLPWHPTTGPGATAGDRCLQLRWVVRWLRRRHDDVCWLRGRRQRLLPGNKTHSQCVFNTLKMVNIKVGIKYNILSFTDWIIIFDTNNKRS